MTTQFSIEGFERLGFIKSIQYGTIVSTVAVADATINRVVRDNSLVFGLGTRNNASGEVLPGYLAFSALSMVDDLTVRRTLALTNTYTIGSGFVVVEFHKGVLRGPVQRGSTQLISGTSTTATLSVLVNLNRALLAASHYTNGDPGALGWDVSAEYKLTANNTITFTRAGSSASFYVTTHWQVADFN